MYISRNDAPFVQFKANGAGLIPVLWYLHAIIAYTITGRSDRQTVVTSTDTGILSHMFWGFLVYLTYIFACQACDYASSTLKKSLGLDPFITRVTTYFQIHTSKTQRCNTSTIPLEYTILQNMHMLQRVGDHYIVRENELRNNGNWIGEVYLISSYISNKSLKILENAFHWNLLITTCTRVRNTREATNATSPGSTTRTVRLPRAIIF